MATKYTKADIEAAAAAALSGLISEADRNTLVAAVYAANKSGTDLLDAFKAAIAGGSPPPDLCKSFVDAANAAKTKRLSDNAARRAGGAAPSDPLGIVLEDADKKFAVLSGLADATSKSAASAESDADAADVTVGKIKKYRPLTSREEHAAGAARTAATDARTVAGEVETQFEGGSSALEAIELVVLAKGPLAEADTARNEIEAARITVAPLSRTAARHAGTALRNREMLDRSLAALTGGGQPPVKNPPWWRKYAKVGIATVVSLVALGAAYFFEGVPEMVFPWAVVIVLIAAAYAVVNIDSSERAAGIVMVLALALTGYAYIVDGGSGDGGNKDGGDIINQNFPTVDGSQFTEWAPGTRVESADGLSPIIIIGSIILAVMLGLAIRQWLSRRHTVRP